MKLKETTDVGKLIRNLEGKTFAVIKYYISSGRYSGGSDMFDGIGKVDVYEIVKNPLYREERENTEVTKDIAYDVIEEYGLVEHDFGDLGKVWDTPRCDFKSKFDMFFEIREEIENRKRIAEVERKRANRNKKS